MADIVKSITEFVHDFIIILVFLLVLVPLFVVLKLMSFDPMKLRKETNISYRVMK